MEDQIFETIRSWAGVATWYTGHPLDQKRFSQAMADLVSEFGPNIDIDEFESALKRHAESNPEILGSPSRWEEIISKYVAKAETIFTYEQSKII